MPPSILSIHSADTATLASKLTLDPNTARIEIQCLLQKVLQVARVYLLAHPERCLTSDELSAYQALLHRRLQGEPIAYILAEREFYSLNFKVTSATLIPRPDTELLVDLALQRLPAQQSYSVLDLGTGSGAIALAIAKNRPDADVVASDASSAALAVAQENSRALHIKNVRFLLSDWYTELAAQRYTLIVSNPPYIAAGDPHLAHGDVRFEPLCALASGDDGLDDIRHIIIHTPRHLLPGGWLLLEHGYDQATRVRELLQQAGFTETFSARDLAGIERVSGGKLPT